MKPCKSLFLMLLLATACCVLVTPVAVAGPSIFPFGVTIHGPSVSPGHVIYIGRDNIVYMVDVDGNTVRTWKSPTVDGDLVYARPIENGNILSTIRLRTDGLKQSDASGVVELDKAGNVDWLYIRQPGGIIFHHDLERMSNGNTLILCAKTLQVPSISSKPLRDDCLLEVDPNGQTVWEWQTADHFAEFEFSADTKAKISAAGGDWAHANSASVIPAGTPQTDPRFAPGNIIVSYRFTNSIVIVDRLTGAIVWKTHDLTLGQHNAHMIPGGLPGAGKILVFDNGWGGHYNNGGAEVTRFYSRVVEINPLDMTIVQYTAAASKYPLFSFFSHFIGSSQRLPNGNTLIDEGSNGRIFEVDSKGQIVWEFMNSKGLPGDSSVYRAEKVQPGWELLGL